MRINLTHFPGVISLVDHAMKKKKKTAVRTTKKKASKKKKKTQGP